MSNPFFINNGPLKIHDIFKLLNIDEDESVKNCEILNIRDLVNSNINDITFFHSNKYKDAAKITKASFCITT